MTYTSLTLDDIDSTWRQTGRWRQGAAFGTVSGMILPVQVIFVHHTVSPDTGDVRADVAGPCDTDQREFGKVSYSWNIHHSTRSVIEVEGTHRGAHTVDGHGNSLNQMSFGFGVVGNYHPPQLSPPPLPVGDDLVELCAEAIVDKAIRPGYARPGVVIAGHKDSGFATACCGDTLYARLPDIRAAVARLLSPTHPEDDMPPNPAIVRDATGRQWVIVVGDNGAAFAHVDGSKPMPIGRPGHPEDGGFWTSGFSAELVNGKIVVVGRGGTGETFSMTFDPAHADQQPVFENLHGHIYPPK